MLKNSIYQHFLHTMQSFGPWPVNPNIGIAVSGGPDSLALLLLAQQWAHTQGGQVVALHVDHRLRPTSQMEAEALETFCAQHQIACHVLVWEHNTVVSKIQQQAREARYSLLLAKCAALGILHLLTGHHQNDQVETIYMRANRKSGARGLGGIHACTWTPYARILRPLLSHSKKELLEYMKPFSYLQDPSNLNTKFERVRARKELDAIPEEILQTFLNGSKTLQQSRKEEEIKAWKHLAKHATLDPLGFAVLNNTPYYRPTHTIITFLLQYVSGKMYPPSQQALENLISCLIAHPQKAYTIHNCIIWNTGEKWYFVAEHRHSIFTKIESLKSFYWNHRFLVDLITKKHLYLGLELSMLGNNGWQQICHLPMEEISVPWRILESLPAFWLKGHVIGVPHLNMNLMPDSNKEPLPRLRFLTHYDMLRFQTAEKK